MDLICRRTTLGGVPAVSVSGEIDLASVPVLRDALLRAVDEHRGEMILVDLDGVTVLDDSGLGVLLGAAGRARSAGGDLALVVSSPRLRERFDVTGLSRAIDVRLGSTSEG